MNYATFWQRFAAMWIDVFVLAPLIVLQAGRLASTRWAFVSCARRVSASDGAKRGCAVLLKLHSLSSAPFLRLSRWWSLLTRSITGSAGRSVRRISRLMGLHGS